VFSIDHFGLDQYRRAVDDGRLPIALLARLPRPAAAAYRLFWQAYTGHIPIDEDDRLLTHPVASLLTRVARLGGWLQSEDGSLALTPDGYNGYNDLERWVTYHLIEPLWGELMHEHEAAV
jgi:oxygen-independent coproporphyrinogen-3 oxidase